MGVLKKVLMGLGIAVAAVIIVAALLLIIGLYQVSVPPKIEVKSAAVVDHDGYPAIKVVFETEKYPVKFYLMTPEGEEIYSTSASEPEKVVYLHLTPMKPYTNIIEERKYIVKVLYLDKEIWEKEIDIKGVKPSIEIVDIKGKPELLQLTLKSIIIKVKNLGDVPLYVTNIPENIKIHVDGEKAPCTVETTTILPNESKVVEIELLASIKFDELGKDHNIEVEVAGKRVKHVIPKLEPELKLLDRKYGESLGSLYLDNVTISIANNWVFPIHVKWIRVFINGEEYSALVSAIPGEVEEIGTGETVELTLKLPWLTAKEGSKVEIALGASKLELRA